MPPRRTRTVSDVDVFPHNVLDLVAQHLSALDVVRLARVCRAWRDQLGRLVLTERLRVTYLRLLHAQWVRRRASAAAWLVKNLRRTRDLEFHGLGEPVQLDLLTAATVNGLERLVFSSCGARQLPNLATSTALRELTVVDCDRIKELPSLDALAPQLVRLEVVNCSRLTRVPALTGFTALRAIKLRANDSLALPPSLSSLTGLTSLEAHGCSAKTLPSLDSFPSLRALDIEESNIKEPQLLRLTACTELSSLRVANCCRKAHGLSDYNYRGAHLPPLTALPALSSLQLLHYDIAGRFPSLASCGQLRSVFINRCSALRGVLDLSGCERLEELECKDCPELQALPSLAACGQLHRLHLEHCNALQAVPDLSGCSGLQELRFKRCDSLQALPSLSSCGQLHRLHLESCGALQAVPDLSSCLDLQELRLKYCCSLQALPSLAACGQLHRLHLEHCNALQAVPDLSGCSGLQELRLKHFSHLEALPSLSSCGQLRRLYFWNCSSLRAIPDLTCCTQLAELCCGKCDSLQALPSLSSCGQLHVLYINGCSNVRALPDLSSCKQLTELHCRDCWKLKKLPELAACTNLKELRVSDCHALFRTRDFQIVLQGLRSHGINVHTHRINFLYDSPSGLFILSDSERLPLSYRPR